MGCSCWGPIILIIYLADRLARRKQGLTTGSSEERLGRYRWWAHVGGATVLVGLACLGNPYGLRGALLPLELFPKITAWGGQYKTYIIEFGDLQEFVRKQGLAAASGLYLRADCFLLWVVPLSFIMPAIWRTGRADISSPAWTKGCIGAFGFTVSLVLASVLGFPGPGTPAWLIRLGRLAPLGLVALGAVSAVILVRASRRAALLAVVAGATMAMWVLWLRAHLLGLEPGLGAWFGGNGSVVLGWGTVLIGGATAVLVFRAGGRFFTMALAITFSYLALQAIRNINLFGLVAGFVTTWNLGEWTAKLTVETNGQERRPVISKVERPDATGRHGGPG